MRGLIDTLVRLSSPWAYIVVGLLATAEAVLVGLVLPASWRCCWAASSPTSTRVSLPVMLLVATVAAIAGHLLGELGAAPVPACVAAASAGASARTAGTGPRRHAARGGQAILVGRFVGVLRVLLGALAATARCIARHPQRIQAAAARQLERPGMRALHRPLRHPARLPGPPVAAGWGAGVVADP